jgi:hypothetical protein
MSNTITEATQTQSVRQWAQANGYEVKATGRLSLAVREAYDKAHAA